MRPPNDAKPVTCPRCSAATVNLLEYSSAIAWVWWLRCTACGNVWTLPKDPPKNDTGPA